MSVDKQDVEVVWPKGRTIEIFKANVRSCAYNLEHGSLLAIDPASRSAGWAWFKAGELEKSGTIKAKGSDINLRLQSLSVQLAELGVPDVVAIEHVRGSMAHEYLKYSVGAVLAGVKSPKHMFVPIPAWKAVSKTVEGYSKTDEEDAKIIGLTVIKMRESL